MISKRNKSAEEAFIVVSAVFLMMLFVIFYSLNTNKYNFEAPVDVSDNWEMVSEAHTGMVTMTREITEAMQGKALLFRTTDAILNIYIDDVEIYKFSDTTSICRSPGSAWHIVNIPRRVNENTTLGCKLTLEIRQVYSYKFRDKLKIFMGTSGDLILSKVYSELKKITIIVVLVITGVLMCVIYSVKVSRKTGEDGIKKELYLGILTILVSILFGCGMFTSQMFIASGILQYFIYYSIMMVVPLVLMLYLKEIFIYFDCVPYFFIHTAVVAVFTAFQLFGVQEYVESEPIYIAVFICEFLAIAYDLYKSYNKQFVLISKYEIVALIILCISIIGNFIQFLDNPASDTDLLITASGLLIYVAVSIYTSILTVIPAIMNSVENDKLSKLAFIDGSTQVYNRMAFNRDVKKIDLKDLYITALDLNNLKYYNDNYGHNVGDELIQAAVEVLKEVYGESSVYRVGGDEFIILKSGIEREDQSRWRQELSDRTNEYTNNNRRGLILEIACGDASYVYGDMSYEEVYKRADHNMYEHKSVLKEHSKIKYVRKD